MPDFDVTVLRGNRKYGDYTVPWTGDAASMRTWLRDHLAGDGWDQKLWPQFTAEVRLAGQGKLLAKVRAV